MGPAKYGLKADKLPKKWGKKYSMVVYNGMNFYFIDPGGLHVF